ncbi:MAG: DUF4234 domain-containing protein [Armatimonadetes bacterium]|nr:MAG: DUF4234 domain-containing protein [Armatimonadota bacterium]
MSTEHTMSGGGSPSDRPLGRGRSKGLTILVTIVTLGIWTLVWSYQNGEELKKYRNDGLGGAIYLILTFIFAPITMFMMADEVGKLYIDDGQPAPITALWGLWILLPIIGLFVWYIKIQNCLNDFWESKGAAPAAGL